MIFTSLLFSALAAVNLVLWPAWQLWRSVSTRSEDSEAVELVRMEVEELVTELDWSGSVWRHSGCHGTAPLTEARNQLTSSIRGRAAQGRDLGSPSSTPPTSPSSSTLSPSTFSTLSPSLAALNPSLRRFCCSCQQQNAVHRWNKVCSQLNFHVSNCLMWKCGWI